MLPLRSCKSHTDLPTPINGIRFNVHEAINEYKKFKGKKYKMVKEWIRIKHIPCGESRFFHLLKEEKEGRVGITTPWNEDRGRQPFLSLQQVEDLIHLNKSESAGRCSSVNDIEKTLNSERERQLNVKGLSTVGHTSVCRRTVRNYRSIVGLSDQTKIVKKVQQKTEQRYTAESSLLSTLSYLMTVACTHLFIGERDEYIHTSSVVDGTEGAKRLHDLVMQCNGNAPLKYALPALITSTDDTTMFVFKGTAPSVESWHVVPVLDQKNRKDHQSYFSNNVGGTSLLNGTRVRLTFTMNALGNTAAPFITVYGKIKYPKGHLILELPGLCAGGTQDLRLNEVGYVCFVRTEKSDNGKTVEQRNFEFYREKVLMPFLSSARSRYYDWVEGTPIPDDLTAVCWSDGACTQLQAITSEKQQVIDQSNRIVTCKHSASRTSEEQACDLASVFRSQRTISQNTTGGKNLVLAKAFKSFKSNGWINLSATKEQALLDFLSCYPAILSKCASANSVQKGFVYNGMVDNNTKNWPDMNSILATCKNLKLRREEEEKIIESFPKLYEEQMEKGHLSDEFFEGLGFKPDKNYSGKEVRRLAGITNESCQRAKCLSHNYQRDLRKKVILEYKNKEVEKVLTTRNKAKEQYLLSAIIENKLANQNDTTMGVFVQFKIAELKAFIYVRSYTEMKNKIDKSFQMPKNKGRLEAAERGERNLLTVAFSLKDSEKILTVPEALTVTDLEENLTGIAVPVIHLGQSIEKEASTYLSNNDWIQAACTSFSGLIRQEPGTVVSPFKKIQANTLHKMLLRRYKQHIYKRIKKKDKHNSYALQWFVENLPSFCAIAVLSTHVIEDLQSSTDSTTLVAHPGNEGCVFHDCASAEVTDLEGCYLYYDQVKYAWIRSGKAVGSKFSNPKRSFGKRHAEHKMEASKNATNCKYDKSLFYRSYPSKSIPSTDGIRRRGYFENLRQYCGIGFNREKDMSKLVDKKEGSGIFKWSEDVIQKVNKLTLYSCTELEEKQLVMVGYLLELGYDLMINADDNISESPGFEACLGIFGGEN